jgi:hypothetical protein
MTADSAFPAQVHQMGGIGSHGAKASLIRIRTGVSFGKRSDETGCHIVVIAQGNARRRLGCGGPGNLQKCRTLIYPSWLVPAGGEQS